MKKLGFNTRIWGWTVMTVFLTMTTWYVYKVQTDVLSRGQAMEILSKYGTVQTSGGILIFTQQGEIQALGYTTELLQALEMMSNDFDIHM